MPEKSRIDVAVVSKAHGIRGEIVAIPHDPGSTSLGEVTHVWVGERQYTVVRARPVPPGAYLLALEGLTDRDVAAGLRGQHIEVERDELDLDDDEVLLGDLVGCKVELPDGRPWGEIVGVELGFQDRLVIHQDGKERLLPVVDAFVLEIDLEHDRVVVDPPEGLPEDPVS